MPVLKQNMLFPAQPILQKRLESERFDDIPTTPGIYRFYDKNEKLLYVGKAKNLRKRLFSYKRAKAGQVPVKVGKLISRIKSFQVDQTETEQEALLLENQWIRGYRPPFNHANKQPEAYYFVYMNPDEHGLEFRLAMRIDDETDKKFWYGCFKGHAPVRKSMGSLLQLLWMAEMDCFSPQHLPVQLTRWLTPAFYRMNWHGSKPGASRNKLSEYLVRWMKGESCEILDWFVVRLECGKTLSLFQQRFLEDRLYTLKFFFDRKLVRHRYIREKLLNGSRIIAQDELDDLIVKI